MKRIGFLLLLSIICSKMLQAQVPNKAYVDNIVPIIAQQIKDNYVLEEEGKIIAAYFLEDLTKGRFYQAQSLKKLDSIMTKSLREASNNDFHLFTWNNLEIVQQLKAEKEESEDTGTTSFFNDKKAYNANFGFEKVEVLTENIGYIKLTQINISDISLETLYSAMHIVKNTNALIIDLRDNGGGGSSIGPVLETFFFENQVELLKFRERNGSTESSTTVGWLLEEMYLKPLYVLTNKGTASAAEEFVFALKNQDRCITVGENTSGDAYMNTYFPVNEEFIVSVSTAAPFLPGTNKSWQGKGVPSDHQIESEKALTKAIQLINNTHLKKQ